MPRDVLPFLVLLALGAPMLAWPPAAAAAPPAEVNAPFLPGFDAAVGARPAPPPPAAAPAPAAPAPAAPPAVEGGVEGATGTPAAGLGLESTASDYMAAAAQAVAQQQGALAEELLGRAETRLISRSVPLYQTNNPSADPGVQQIEAARAAVRGGDFATAAAVIARATPLVAREENTPPPNPPVGLPPGAPPAN